MAKYVLKNKRVVISGASGGFGKELAVRLVKNYGCNVIGIGRNEEKLRALQDDLPGFTYRVFDVSNAKNWNDFACDLQRIGFTPDLLINNAGFLLPFAKTEYHSAKDAEEILYTNFLSCFYSFSALLPLLKKSADPAVVNVSSSAALAPVVGTALYSASKAAVRNFTECLAMDYKNQIYVAGVYPGFTKTNIFSRQNGGADNKILEKFCTPVDRAVGKILKKIKKRKIRIITGADAKAMNFFYRLFPSLTAKAIRAVLKKSDLEIFADIFHDKKSSSENNSAFL